MINLEHGTKLTTDFNLSQGGVYLHGFVATFKRR